MDVTVITPTIKGRELALVDALHSVRQQTVAAEHVVILDDKRKGPAWARNKGIREATTEWVAFLDDDDVLLPNHLETLLKHSKHADIVYSLPTAEGRDDWHPQHFCNMDRIEHTNWIPVTVLARRKVLLDVGGFPGNTEPPDFEDWALWRKLHKAGYRFKCVHQFTWIYRFKQGSRSYA